jgi:hypothetical protein
LPTSETIAGHAVNTIGRTATTSSTVATREMGWAIRSASLGTTRRTMMPTANGASTVMKTSRAMAAGATCREIAKALSRSSTATGTNTIASSAAATSSPTA